MAGGGFDSRTPHFGLLAQLVERLVYTQLVVGSSPAQSTMRSSPWESGPLWGCHCHPGILRGDAGWVRFPAQSAALFACGSGRG